MAERLGRPISKQRGWEALHRLGFTMHQPRPQATTTDQNAQEAFKKAMVLSVKQEVSVPATVYGAAGSH